MTRILLPFLLFTPLLSFAQETETPEPLRWIHDYTSALDQAQQSGKPILIDFHASWCGPCKLLDKETFANPQVIETLRDYVLLKIDIDRDRKTAFAYEVSSIPRLIALNTHMQIVADGLGYRDANQFLAWEATFAEHLRSEQPGLPHAPGIHLLQQRDAVAAIDASDEQAHATLLQALAHTEPSLRKAAFDSVRNSGEQAIPWLLDALQHELLAIRIAASTLLAEITNTDLNYDPWADAPTRRAAANACRQKLTP